MAYGTSGTIRAIADLTQEKDGGAIITRDSLVWLAKQLSDGNDSILKNVPELRRSVLPAGLGILQAVFDQLKIEAMHVADAALKEGLLWDTIGRLSDKDVRNRTVSRLQEKYLLDADHAARVAKTAGHLWKQINGPVLPGISRSKVLHWAAQLHEIGMSISHSGYHNHGYYILRYSDLAGFGRYEQYILANLVRSHRKSLSLSKFEDLSELGISAFIPLLVCLRLSALIHRRREELDVDLKFRCDDLGFRLKFPEGWLQENPLTLAGLEQEQAYFENIDIGLEIR